MKKVSLSEKFRLIDDHWNPRIVGELNGQHAKLAKLHGEFVWHKHDAEDELFFVVKGQLKIELRNSEIILNPNEFFIVPRGVEHRPIAENEVQVMLFEPNTTLNTGDQKDSNFTKEDLHKI